MQVRRGLLSPDLKCPNCGQVSRIKIDVKRAIWIWPLTIGIFIGLFYILEKFIYNESTITCVLVVFALFLLSRKAIQKGGKLVPIEAVQDDKLRIFKWWIMPLSCMIVSVLLIGYYTQDWIEILFGYSIGLIAWGFFYLFSRKSS